MATTNSGVARANETWRTLAPPDASIEEWRAAFSAMCATHELPPGTQIQEIEAGGVPALWVSSPGCDRSRAGLMFHSGGYVMGSASDYREFAGRVSAATRSPILVVDYRLAPEHVYPAALEDALASYRWLARQHDPSQLFLIGDSAGGGLVLATLVSLRDAGEPLPAGAVIISPVTDQAATGASVTENDGIDPLVTGEMILGMGHVYLDGRDPAETPLAAPLYADLHGLPPLHVEAGQLEVLRDDATRVAEKAAAAGGDVDLHVVDEVPHVWTLFPYVPQAAQTLDRVSAFVDRVLAEATTA